MKALELRVPPVAVALLTALAMWMLSKLVPSFDWPRSVRLAVALVLALAGTGVALAGVREFRRARTTVNPMKPEAVSSIVRTGVYRYSRNPMYLGVLLLLSGLAAWLANILALAALPAFVAYMNRFQIAPEERALAARFRSDFDGYRQAVRRWL